MTSIVETFKENMKLALLTYENRHDEFVRDDHNQYVVIDKNGDVLGFFNDEFDAYFAGLAKCGKGGFLLEVCKRPDELEIPTFHSRVGHFT